MTTTVASVHSVDYPQRLDPEDDPNDFVVSFVRTCVQLRALETLARVYPCVTKADGLETTVTTRQERDIFGRTDFIGTATAPCGTPETCTATRKARP